MTPGVSGMEGSDVDNESAQSRKCHDTRRLNHFMLIYIIGVILISFYTLYACQ